MQLIKTLTAIAASAAFFSSSVTAAMSAKQMAANIDVITQASLQLQGPANSINLLSGPLFLIGQGPFPKIIIGFTNIINTVQNDIQAMQGTNPFKVKSDEKLIVDAFTSFVTIHQELLNIMIGKAGILNDLPLVGPPVASVLRQLESVVDSIAFGIIDLVPDYVEPMTTQKGKLDITITLAISAYSPTF